MKPEPRTADDNCITNRYLRSRTPIPVGGRNDYLLSSWMTKQRKEKKKGKIDPLTTSGVRTGAREGKIETKDGHKKRKS